MQTLDQIRVEDEVAENLRLEAEVYGKTVEQVAAERLRARPYTGLGDEMRRHLQGAFLQPGEMLEECSDDGFHDPTHG